MRWIPVQLPAPETADEDEEMAAPGIEAPSENRDGSVCDLRRRGGPIAGGAGQDGAGAGAAHTVPDVPPAVDPVAAAAIIPDVARRQAGVSQQEQLESLLRRPIGPPPTKAEAYAADRARYATLRAFDRKLRQLEAQSRSLEAASAAAIARLDVLHPEYRGKFRDNYERELRKSGMDVSALPFAEFLDSEPPTVEVRP